MAEGSDPKNESFLGGGPKFNQAGNNKPMPGEKVADAVANPLPFGGPRVWIGTLIVIVLIAILWVMFGSGLPGTQSVHDHGGVSGSSYQPNLNPDSKQ